MIPHEAVEFGFGNGEKMTPCKTLCERVNISQICHHLFCISFINISLEGFAAIGLKLQSGEKPQNLDNKLCGCCHFESNGINPEFEKVVNIDGSD